MWGFKKKASAMFKTMAFTIAVAFIATLVGADMLRAKTGYASLMNLPQPNQILNLSAAYSMPVLKGLKFDPLNPLNVSFFIDPGTAAKVNQEEASTLIRYFLAALTIPEKDVWVNLSPYENDRVVNDNLGITDMGRDLLAQDYVLKQLSASLSNPDTKLGKDYWESTYETLLAETGATSLPVNTFNKIWITPKSAEVYEDNGLALVVDAKLTAMLEEDYLAMNNSVADIQNNDYITKEKIEEVSSVTSRMMKEYLLPKVIEDVNNGKNFANLRQIYNAQILAAWFKNKFEDSFYANYINAKKVGGIDTIEAQEKDKLFALYVQAFQKGVYNFVKKETDPSTNQKVKRQYFSGGYMTGDKVNYTTADNSSAITGLKMFIATILLGGAVANSDVNAQTPDGAPKTYKKIEIQQESDQLLEAKQEVKAVFDGAKELYLAGKNFKGDESLRPRAMSEKDMRELLKFPNLSVEDRAKLLKHVENTYNSDKDDDRYINSLGFYLKQFISEGGKEIAKPKAEVKSPSITGAELAAKEDKLSKTDSSDPEYATLVKEIKDLKASIAKNEQIVENKDKKAENKKSDLEGSKPKSDKIVSPEMSQVLKAPLAQVNALVGKYSKEKGVLEGQLSEMKIDSKGKFEKMLRLREVNAILAVLATKQPVDIAVEQALVPLPDPSADRAKDYLNTAEYDSAKAEYKRLWSEAIAEGHKAKAEVYWDYMDLIEDVRSVKKEDAYYTNKKHLDITDTEVSAHIKNSAKIQDLSAEPNYAQQVKVAVEFAKNPDNVKLLSKENQELVNMFNDSLDWLNEGIEKVQDTSAIEQDSIPLDTLVKWQDRYEWIIQDSIKYFDSLKTVALEDSTQLDSATIIASMDNAKKTMYDMLKDTLGTDSIDYDRVIEEWTLYMEDNNNIPKYIQSLMLMLPNEQVMAFRAAVIQLTEGAKLLAEGVDIKFLTDQIDRLKKEYDFLDEFFNSHEWHKLSWYLENKAAVEDAMLWVIISDDYFSVSKAEYKKKKKQLRDENAKLLSLFSIGKVEEDATIKQESAIETNKRLAKRRRNIIKKAKEIEKAAGLIDAETEGEVESLPVHFIIESLEINDRGVFAGGRSSILHPGKFHAIFQNLAYDNSNFQPLIGVFGGIANPNTDNVPNYFKAVFEMQGKAINKTGMTEAKYGIGVNGMLLRSKNQVWMPFDLSADDAGFIYQKQRGFKIGFNADLNLNTEFKNGMDLNLGYQGLFNGILSSNDAVIQMNDNYVTSHVLNAQLGVVPAELLEDTDGLLRMFLQGSNVELLGKYNQTGANATINSGKYGLSFEDIVSTKDHFGELGFNLNTGIIGYGQSVSGDNYYKTFMAQAKLTNAVITGGLKVGGTKDGKESIFNTKLGLRNVFKNGASMNNVLLLKFTNRELNTININTNFIPRKDWSFAINAEIGKELANVEATVTKDLIWDKVAKRIGQRRLKNKIERNKEIAQKNVVDSVNIEDKIKEEMVKDQTLSEEAAEAKVLDEIPVSQYISMSHDTTTYDYKTVVEGTYKYESQREEPGDLITVTGKEFRKRLEKDQVFVKGDLSDLSSLEFYIVTMQGNYVKLNPFAGMPMVYLKAIKDKIVTPVREKDAPEGAQRLILNKSSDLDETLDRLGKRGSQVIVKQDGTFAMLTKTEEGLKVDNGRIADSDIEALEAIMSAKSNSDIVGGIISLGDNSEGSYVEAIDSTKLANLENIQLRELNVGGKVEKVLVTKRDGMLYHVIFNEKGQKMFAGMEKAKRDAANNKEATKAATVEEKIQEKDKINETNKETKEESSFKMKQPHEVINEQVADKFTSSKSLEGVYKEVISKDSPNLTADDVARAVPYKKGSDILYIKKNNMTTFFKMNGKQVDVAFSTKLWGRAYNPGEKMVTSGFVRPNSDTVIANPVSVYDEVKKKNVKKALTVEDVLNFAPKAGSALGKHGGIDFNNVRSMIKMAEGSSSIALAKLDMEQLDGLMFEITHFGQTTGAQVLAMAK